MSEPRPRPSKPLEGRCNATYGIATCTENPGHDGDHWDERTEHEWSREDDE